MPKSVTAARAKAGFSECLRLVEAGESVVITRYGRPVAALVAPGDLERLRRLRAAGPQGGLGSLIGAWKDGEELVKAVEDVVRRRGRARPVEPLE